MSSAIVDVDQSYYTFLHDMGLIQSTRWYCSPYRNYREMLVTLFS